MTLLFMDQLKKWGANEANRLKEAALRDLNPKNPNKSRLVSAWGLIIVGVLLAGSLMMVYRMLHQSSDY